MVRIVPKPNENPVKEILLLPYRALGLSSIEIESTTVFSRLVEYLCRRRTMEN